jgi:hypothetical protein
MIAFLPVTKYRVQYQVATGRPYSALERLMLESVGAGQRTLDELCDTFQVHRRVVVEAIVTLMKAGWLALHPEGSFVVTELGTKILSHGVDALPPSIQIEERESHVILERVQGQVAKNSDVDYVPRSRLKDRWEAGVLVRKGEQENSVQPGMIESLLYRDRANGEWIRWIGKIHVVRDNVDFVVVHVDPDREVITGIPPQWEALLKQDLLTRTRRRRDEIHAEPPDDPTLKQFVRRGALQSEADAGDTDRHLIRLDPGDLINGLHAHRAILSAWLRSASYLAIASASLSEETITALQPELLSAVKRGILIDVVWGTADGPGHGSALKVLKKLEYDSLRDGGSGRLLVNHHPTGTHAEVLLGDPNGTFAAVVGGYPLLHGDDAPALSIHLRHPGPLSRLCHVVADLAARDPHLANGAGVRFLRNSAADLEGRLLSESPTGDTEVRLVLDRQHGQLLRELAERPPRRLLIASPVWSVKGREAAALLRQALERGCTEVRVRAPAEADTAEDQALLEKCGAFIERAAAPSVLLSDQLAVVGSWRWLAPALLGTNHGADVGVVLRGPGAATAAELFAQFASVG